MKDGRAPRIPQDLSQGGYFGGRRPEDGRIDWRWTAERIYNLIRAVTDPYPGAFCHMADGSKLLIWWAIPKEERALDKTRPPGLIEIDGKQILVWTGKGQIRLLNVQIGNEKISGEGIFLYFKDKEGMLLT